MTGLGLILLAVGFGTSMIPALDGISVWIAGAGAVLAGPGIAIGAEKAGL